MKDKEAILADLKRGSVISGPFWPEPVKVDLVESYESYLHIIGSLLKSGGRVDDLIPLKDLDKIKLKTINRLFKEEAWKVFLSLEVLRYKYASLYDPLLAVNVSKIDPLPHQIEAVYGYINHKVSAYR
ncbi:MAG: hypothetical protein NZ900_04445 [Synergistetes bacterium]|nr:hypothetical protein [Synergistota bacterium]MDW8192169.1 hypothetical protein [Synergistota bacterium]